MILGLHFGILFDVFKNQFWNWFRQRLEMAKVQQRVCCSVMLVIRAPSCSAIWFPMYLNLAIWNWSLRRLMMWFSLFLGRKVSICLASISVQVAMEGEKIRILLQWLWSLIICRLIQNKIPWHCLVMNPMVKILLRQNRKIWRTYITVKMMNMNPTLLMMMMLRCLLLLAGRVMVILTHSNFWIRYDYTDLFLNVRNKKLYFVFPLLLFLVWDVGLQDCVYRCWAFKICTTYKSISCYNYLVEYG